jgi:Ca2+-binding EF-hand superfamily protein
MESSLLSRVSIFSGLILAFALIAGMPPFQTEFRSDEVTAVWQRVDQDQDGAATRRELSSTNARLAEHFSQADADEDGALTFEEFEALLNQSEPLPGAGRSG